ncbi:MAG: hypothetical protein EOM53_03605 [Alphaproteobacteria bacterium]|nr:hypothetical protein [Alphaproteobacteria bacterium]
MNNILLKRSTRFLSPKEAQSIRDTKTFSADRECLGGQSSGFYFFSTQEGIDSQMEFNETKVKGEAGTSRYILQAEVPVEDIKYPNWKLDTEAMKDPLFKMIFFQAKKQSFTFENITVDVQRNKLSILKETSYNLYRSFTPDMSGVVEKIADYLYETRPDFKKTYDTFLSAVAAGKETPFDKSTYALKSTKCPPIIKVEEYHSKPKELEASEPSRIDLFYKKYVKSQHAS